MDNSRLNDMRFYRDLLAKTLDAWVMVEEKRIADDSELLKSLADNTSKAYFKASEALALLFPEAECECGHCDEDDTESVKSERLGELGFEERNKWRAMRDLAELAHCASVVKEEPAPATTTVAAPATTTVAAVPEAEHFAANAYFRHMGYSEKLIHNTLKPVWAAYKISKEAGRQAELEHGSWATVGKKRMMIYKNHAFEPPSDRDYAVPGPLKHLGKYNRAAKRVDRLAPGEVAPEVPQTADDYPWWQPHVARSKA